MGRPVKKGLDYFPTDVDFFEKEEIKFFSVECGASGICALMKLMCNIYRNGYYVEWSKDHEDLFGWDMRGMVPREEIPHIIGVCLKRGIFVNQYSFIMLICLLPSKACKYTSWISSDVRI